mmetsp:Transcript_45/g.126  ORF Transcript_45/g.126 Transcript_45/m.126 type:complete len:537 (+) Transcript_45:112-1722(+)
MINDRDRMRNSNRYRTRLSSGRWRNVCFGFGSFLLITALLLLARFVVDVKKTRSSISASTVEKFKQEEAPDPNSFPIGHVLHKATNNDTDGKFRVLYIMTTLAEYDSGTRGTDRGGDRLQNVVIPTLRDSIGSMKDLGWHVDLVLILGYEKLAPERLQLIYDAVAVDRIEVWEDAVPFFYSDRNKKQDPNKKQIALAYHGLSRQHRYVIKDKLPDYDFFLAFEDDMRVTESHVLNFLELSSMIETLGYQAENNLHNLDQPTEVINPSLPRDPPHDKAKVGNDVAAGPLTAEQWKRVIPGFLRVEVNIEKESPSNGGLTLHNFPHKSHISVHPDTPALLPGACCSPQAVSIDQILMWETDIRASGVRKYPPPLDWMAAMPLEDSADIGSYWSGHKNIFGDNNPKRPRRVDATLGQQAGFMATASQIEFFHNEACAGEFLPPFKKDFWRGDSLKRHSVEFWSGGFQLFGTCGLNRVLSLDPERFSKQLLFHTSNNKQHSKKQSKFYRIGDFFGQLYTVRQHAQAWIEQHIESPVDKNQ